MFSDKNTNAYFWQNYIRRKKHEEKHGGFRGLVWRSVNEFKTYGENDVCSVDDASFMFKIINHFVNNTTERNQELLEIFDGIKKRYDVRNKSDPPNVVLPTNETEMNMYLLPRWRTGDIRKYSFGECLFC